MGVGAGLYMYNVVVKKFTFAISSPDEFLFIVSVTKSLYCTNSEILLLFYENDKNTTPLVAWSSGRTLVFGRCAFASNLRPLRLGEEKRRRRRKKKERRKKQDENIMVCPIT